jgi:glycosyltransferase involved in cell wall biosynthesis
VSNAIQVDMDESKHPVLDYTVVCPAHRADNYLIDAIESTEKAIGDDLAELVVVANGPSRNEVARLVREVSSLPRTVVIVTEMQSLAHCLNRGIEAASGEYIARMDADDLCLEGRFRHQLSIARARSADVVCSDAVVVNSLGVESGTRLVASDKVWRKCGPIHPAVMMRRDVLLRLGGYGNLEYCEDYHLWLRVHAEGHRIAVDGTSVLGYRRHADQATDRGRITRTFATNIGLKLALGLRFGKLSYLFGAAYDAVCYCYSVCRRAF